MHPHTCRGCGTDCLFPFVAAAPLFRLALLRRLTPLPPPLPPTASMSLVVPEAHVQFQHILRLLNTNVDGKRKIMVRRRGAFALSVGGLISSGRPAVRLDRDQGCWSSLRQPCLQEGRCRPWQAVRRVPALGLRRIHFADSFFAQQRWRAQP